MSEATLDQDADVRCSGCRQEFPSDQVVRLDGGFYCADCKEQHLQDLRSGGVRGATELAGRGTRLAAAIIDGLVLAIPVLGAAFILGMAFADAIMSGSSPIVMENLITGLISLIPISYEGLMLSKSNGQTVGKKVMKIRVVNRDGRPLSTAACWGRGLVRTLFSMLRLLGLIDILFIFGAERRCLHDRAAGSIVVKTDLGAYHERRRSRQ